MKFKLLFTLFLFALFGIGVMNLQSQTVSLEIMKWDNSGNSINVNSLRKITFGSGNVILNYQTGNVENVPASSIRKIVFTSVTGINDLHIDTESMFVYPNPGIDYISLKNLPAGDLTVAIYTLCGNQLLNLQHYTNTDQINISELTKGVYIIKVNNQALKFMKL
jgi:hypothetical protein